MSNQIHRSPCQSSVVSRHSCLSRDPSAAQGWHLPKRTVTRSLSLIGDLTVMGDTTHPVEPETQPKAPVSSLSRLPAPVRPTRET